VIATGGEITSLPVYHIQYTSRDPPDKMGQRTQSSSSIGSSLELPGVCLGGLGAAWA